MSNILNIDKDYASWIEEISERFKASQIKAATKVNDEMLKFYWSLGKDIFEREMNKTYGSNLYNSISQDLQNKLPNVKSFSITNLRYMKRFYELYSNIQIVPQLGEQLKGHQNVPQLGADFNCIFLIPWGHNKLIIDKCKNNPDKALFFVKKTLENGWSRNVLMNFLDTNLYEREGKAITNFQLTLPSPQSDLAQSITKDPYNFDFLTIKEDYNEKELKHALMDNLQNFLLELGKGFAFVGKEYRLVIGETEQFLDMLFYNIPNHCYVVVEMKIRDFEPGDMGQLGTYVAAVDGILKGQDDNQTIGLLICKSKDNVLAQYAVNVVGAPVGISEYELSHLLPDDFKYSLPSIEDIEKQLSNNE